MAGALVKMIEDLLADPTDPEVVRALVDPHITYVSLNFANPELKRIMSWAGTAHGPQAVIDTYAQVGRYWQNKGLSITDRLESADSAAVFGTFTYESNTLAKTITSPFCILIRVRDEKSSTCSSWKTPSAQPRPSRKAEPGRSTAIRKAHPSRSDPSMAVQTTAFLRRHPDPEERRGRGPWPRAAGCTP